MKTHHAQNTPITLDGADLHGRINTGAHAGAYGANDLKTPTDAQAQAGTYKMGRVTVQGLRIAIEQPNGSIRTGKGADGKEWSSRMAAHYGYFEGTRGADGDGIDCFVGPFPESENVFVVNQRNKGGGFDEHKVLLGFMSERHARGAYLDSYERGWAGLQSMVPLSIPQLRWWIKHGNKRIALTAESLPLEASKPMTTKKINWTDTQPDGVSYDQVLYELRRMDGPDGLLLDSVTMAEIMEDTDGVIALDALVVENAQLARMSERLRAIMDRSGGAVKVPAVQVSDPFRARGVTNIATVFELSDGQSVSIFFHNPDTAPNKLAPGDEMISWKWLLNKKDITIVVAPEKGQDLNPRLVAQRIMKLAEKNSPAFQKANAKRAERMGNIEAIRGRIAEKEATLNELVAQVEAARLEKDQRVIAAEDEARKTSYLSIEDASDEQLQYAREGLQGLYAGTHLAYFVANPKNPSMVSSGVGYWLRKDNGAKPTELVYGFDEVDGEMVRRATPEVVEPWKTVDPTTPEGYAMVMAAGEEAQRYWAQNDLDGHFQKRQLDFSRALSGLGWEAAPGGLYAKGGYSVMPRTMTFVANGFNVRYGMKIAIYEGEKRQKIIDDDLSKTPAEIAAEIDAAVPAAEQTPAQRVDAAYQFANATDAFKVRVAESIDKEDYSPFASAKAMDMKAKELGAEIHWGMGAALDGVSVAELGHAPAYTDGTGKWHSYTMEAMKRKDDAALRYIVKDATEAAEAGEKMNNPKAAQYRDEAHYASMEMQRRRKGGRQVMDSVEGWDGITLDDASDFAGSAIVGKIMQGGELKGRAVIGGDGKAMVFVGDSDDQRVRYVHPESGQSRDAIWGDDGVKLVEWLLKPQAAKAQEPAPPVEVYAFKDASDEALGLLRIGAQNPAARSTYKTAVSVQQSADTHGMAIRWEAVSTLPTFDDATGGLFGDGDQGHIRGELTYNGTKLAQVYVREDGMAAFDYDKGLPEALGSDFDQFEDEYTGWSEHWDDVIYKLRNECDDRGFAQRPAVEFFIERLKHAGWSDLGTDMFTKSEDGNVAIEMSEDKNKWPKATLKAWINGAWADMPEVVTEDARESVDFPPNASEDEVLSALSELLASAETLRIWATEHPGGAEHEPDPEPAPEPTVTPDDKNINEQDFRSMVTAKGINITDVGSMNDEVTNASLKFKDTKGELSKRYESGWKLKSTSFEITGTLAEVLDEFVIAATPDPAPAPAPEPAPEPAPAANAEDRAFFMSLIDGTYPDLDDPELVNNLEAAYQRNSEDAEMVSLFTQAINAYTTASLAETEGM
jgi:hypothetical protein